MANLDNRTHDPDAEQALLAYLFTSPEASTAVDSIGEVIEADNFFEPRNQLIYSTILSLHYGGRPFDPVQVLSDIRARNLEDRAGGLEYFQDLINPNGIASYGTDPLSSAATIRDYARRRQLFDIAQQATEAASTGSGMSGIEAAELIEAELRKMMNSEKGSSEIHSVADLFDKSLDRIRSAKDQPVGITRGVPSGFVDLDEATGGFKANQLVFIAARPAVGKSGSLLEAVWTSIGRKKWGELTEQDQIFGADGKLYNVVKVHPIYNDLDAYKVTFSDGQEMVVNGEHEWYTETRAARRSRSEARGAEGRETTLTDAQISMLAEELAKATAEDTLTLYELAYLMGQKAPYPSMLRIAGKLSSVGFATEKVGTKATNTYSRAELATALRNERLTRIHADSVILDKVVNLVHTADVRNERLSVKEVSDYLFGDASNKDTWFYLSQIVRKSKLTGEQEPREVRAAFKAPHPTYNKRELLSAYIEHATSFKNDQRYKNTSGSVKTTLEILETLVAPNTDKEEHIRWNHSIPVAKPLQLPEADLPIDPYVLGAWLGDGFSSHGMICGEDDEIFEEVVLRGYPAGTERRPDLDNRNFRTVRFPSLHKELFNKAWILPTGVSLRNHGPVKHIPEAYFLGSEQQRRDLLAGLMDTDGTVVKDHSTVQFDNTNKRLIDGVATLVASLGAIPRITEGVAKIGERNYGPTWSVTWSTDDPVFHLPRKREAHMEYVAKAYNAERNDRRYIVGIEKVESVPMRCISVDSPDHLFLAGERFIPTHNSTIAVDFARNASFLAGKTVLFFSLEMGKDELVDRIISAEANVESQKMKSGQVSDLEWVKIEEVRARVNTGSLLIDDNPGLGLPRLRAALTRQMSRPEGVDLVIIDYLQLMEVPRGYSQRQEQVSELSRGLKLLAKEMGIPIIVLAQLNRKSEERTDRKPAISDLRESGSLEQDADIILLLHRPDQFDPNNRPGETDLIIGKNRGGPGGTIPLVSMLSFCKFVPGQGTFPRTRDDDDGNEVSYDVEGETDDESIPW